MIFGGIQKSSLIDFPGKVSCVLFTPGCNFTCPYCHNPDLAKDIIRTPVLESDLLAYLDARRGLLDGRTVGRA